MAVAVRSDIGAPGPDDHFDESRHQRAVKTIERRRTGRGLSGVSLLLSDSHPEHSVGAMQARAPMPGAGWPCTRWMAPRYEWPTPWKTAPTSGWRWRAPWAEWLSAGTHEKPIRQTPSRVLYRKSNALILYGIPPGASYLWIVPPNDNRPGPPGLNPNELRHAGRHGHLPMPRAPGRSSAASASAGSCASTTGRRPEHSGRSGLIVCRRRVGPLIRFYHRQAA